MKDQEREERMLAKKNTTKFLPHSKKVVGLIPECACCVEFAGLGFLRALWLNPLTKSSRWFWPLAQLHIWRQASELYCDHPPLLTGRTSSITMGPEQSDRVQLNFIQNGLSVWVYFVDILDEILFLFCSNKVDFTGGKKSNSISLFGAYQEWFMLRD